MTGSFICKTLTICLTLLHEPSSLRAKAHFHLTSENDVSVGFCCAALNAFNQSTCTLPMTETADIVHIPIPKFF
jgi:hypothetical protein